MPPHQTCYPYYDLQSQSHHLTPESACLKSQPSLTSIPSLTSQSNNYHHDSTTHHHCIATIKGHSYISSLALAGKYLYTGSSDKEILLWKHTTLNSEFDQENQADNIVTAGNGAVKSLVILSDKLFSAHQDHKIRVWKIDNSESDDHHKITHLATLPTLSDRALKLITPKSQVQIRRHKKCTWVHHVDTVSALALSADESLLYSVSWDRTLKIWRTTDFKCLESVSNAHDDAINAVALSHDGLIYTGSSDKTIKVWSKIGGEKKHSLVATLDRHKSGVNALVLSKDGLILYSGASDKSIVVWEKDEGVGGGGNMVAVGALRGHSKSILCLTVVGDLVCSGSADKTIRIWRGVERSYSCLAVLEGHLGPVKCLTAAAAAAADNYYNSSDTTSSCLLYSGSLGCDVKVWQIFVSNL